MHESAKRRYRMGALVLAAAMVPAIGFATQAGAASDATPTGSGTIGTAQAGPIGFGAATTGGAGGETVTVTNADEFLAAVQSEEALVVQVDGTISLSGMNDVGSNKTVVGVGTNGVIEGGGGLTLSEVDNVILQNLTISGSSDDNINVEYSTNVWIDHNDLSNASDGALDIKRASDNITVSWNHFHDQDKNALLGHDDGNGDEDTGKLHVTYDHNWFDGTNQRNPRVRFGNPVHVLNNYYSSVGSYGVASTVEAGVLVEANSFENVEDPFHLGEGDSEGGSLVAVDNQLVDSGEGQTGGSVADIPYDYTADSADSVKDAVMSGAGVGKIG